MFWEQKGLVEPGGFGGRRGTSPLPPAKVPKVFEIGGISPNRSTPFWALREAGFGRGGLEGWWCQVGVLFREDATGENGGMTGTRIDKWLWAARFFKTREQASKACDLNRIASNGQSAKPAREVRAGDMLRIKNEGGEFEIEVLALSEVRGPAAVAQTLYRETEESREARKKAAEERKLLGPQAFTPPTKPSKRDRRLIHSFRGRD